MVSISERIHLLELDVVDSTNRLAYDLGFSGAKPWTIVHALEQTSGRGRRQNDWLSPRGNLFLSAILKPINGLKRWSELSFVISLAVADTVAEVADRSSIGLKWPNDVLVNNKKISGILLETGNNVKKESYLVVGVGLNIAHSPTGTRYGATCINELISEKSSVKIILPILIKAMINWYDIWENSGFLEIRKQWLKRAHGLGKRIEIIGIAPKTQEGIYTGISKDGRLVLTKDNGEKELVSAGTVTFV
ncbi:MAG: biotin--[acetyl-CoA-carboxylase] ligase [Rhodospirillaceae bacterium]|nr:biotin--[acetyl-CoA-carboxylase] ligase [Rhodospirillaceae bacterium]